jgi:hypothetical protein
MLLRSWYEYGSRYSVESGLEFRHAFAVLLGMDDPTLDLSVESGETIDIRSG